MDKLLVVLLFMGCFSVISGFQNVFGDILFSGCGVLDTPNINYILTNDIFFNPAHNIEPCIIVDATGIGIFGNGHKISGPIGNPDRIGIGILVTENGGAAGIDRLIIENFDNGIHATDLGSNGWVNVFSSEIRNNDLGINLEGAHAPNDLFSNINDSYIHDNYFGILITDITFPAGIHIARNIISNNEQGIGMGFSADGFIVDNEFNDNTLDAVICEPVLAQLMIENNGDFEIACSSADIKVNTGIVHIAFLAGNNRIETTLTNGEFLSYEPESLTISAGPNTDAILIIDEQQISIMSGEELSIEQYLSRLIGGKLLSIEATALINAGMQSLSWMIPITLSVLGIGLFVVSKKPRKILIFRNKK